jgi:hypothetical protein
MRRNLVLTAVLVGMLLPFVLPWLPTQATVPPEPVPVEELRPQVRGQPLPAPPPGLTFTRAPPEHEEPGQMLSRLVGGRHVPLQSLSPEGQARLREVAMEHLQTLSDRCGALAPDVALGAYMTLDPDGMVELELHPILEVPPGGPVQPLDEPLSPAFERCVDDLLWEQDWSKGTGELAEGTVLEVALTTRPWGED